MRITKVTICLLARPLFFVQRHWTNEYRPKLKEGCSPKPILLHKVFYRVVRNASISMSSLPTSNCLNYCSNILVLTLRTVWRILSAHFEFSLNSAVMAWCFVTCVGLTRIVDLEIRLVDWKTRSIVLHPLCAWYVGCSRSLAHCKLYDCKNLHSSWPRSPPLSVLQMKSPPNIIVSLLLQCLKISSRVPTTYSSTISG